METEKKPDKIWLFQPERRDSGKTLSEVHIHYKSLLTRVCDRAGCTEHCKDFTAALKMIDIINKRQMYESVITGKENTSNYWNLYYIIVFHEFQYFRHFLCVYVLKQLSGFFGTKPVFLVDTGWQPCSKLS